MDGVDRCAIAAIETCGSVRRFLYLAAFYFLSIAVLSAGTLKFYDPSPLSNVTGTISGNSNDKFDNYFHRVRTINLPDEPIIGEVHYLSVDTNGNLLITDYTTRNVFLFNGDGQLKKILDPEECHPGIFWSPMRAVFDNRDDIFVINSGPWGIRFNNDGRCRNVMGRHFIAPLDITFNNHDQIYGYYNFGEQHIKLMDSEGKEVRRFGIFPEEFRNIIGLLENGGIVSDSEQYLYQANVPSNKIYVYDLNGNHIQTIDSKPSYYRAINRDLPAMAGDPAQVIREFQNIVRNRTITYSLHLIDSDRILIQYRHDSMYGIQVFSGSGELLTKEDILVQLPFDTARNGYLYLVPLHEKRMDGTIGNPVIHVYRMNK